MKRSNAPVSSDGVTAWLETLFPPGASYWVPDLHGLLKTRLGLNPAAHSAQGLWGASAETETLLGRRLGWVMDGESLVFFTPSVLEEVARALAVADGGVVPTPQHTCQAQAMMEALGIDHLAERAPDRLSDGETKLLWTAVQAAKTPRWLAFDSLTASLSEATAARLVAFLSKLAPRPVFLVGECPPQGVPDNLGPWVTLPEGEGVPHV